MEHTTIEELVDHAPEAIDRVTLGNLKGAFERAQHFGEGCSYGEMVSSMLSIGQILDDIVDEMAYALKRDRMESAEYDAYVRKLGDFQRWGVSKRLGGILTEKCSCKKE